MPMKRTPFLCALLALLLLAGCAPSRPPPIAVDRPPPSLEPVPPAPAEAEGAAVFGYEDYNDEDAIVRLGPATGAAVRALLADATQAAAAGEIERSGALIERALRIEPNHPVLWHYFARYRFAVGDFAAATGAAQRSNASGASRRLQIDNWTLIAESRRRGGDAEGARQAAERVRILLR